jgi:hypothetical protein
MSLSIACISPPTEACGLANDVAPVGAFDKSARLAQRLQHGHLAANLQ